ncbi:hypothetical protein Y10_25170 [Neptunitalea sp. Y10]|uniref:Pectinesterase catalytic domain-containing protein n=2 Tax=Neptunitalea lumnitzerae TaxID=2965509 RepID=A0ABQ5ML91_9FLAO|nr:hypothetical protein Y10_25170 [Neptunitalea sp. Y10]
MFFFTATISYAQSGNIVSMQPEPGRNGVPIDTQLKIKFKNTPELGVAGKIKIYDAKTDSLVDVLDMSIPPGPTEPNKVKAPYIKNPYKYESTNYTNINTKAGTPSGGAEPTSDAYQLTIIGRFTDGFHFYPVIVNGNEATIYLHNNMLTYNTSYYITIDKSVFVVEGQEFKGITKQDDWVFSTKKKAPSHVHTITVAADGSADFSTVQGAIDFVPDYKKEPTAIYIKNGRYEEIVYFKNKTNVTFKGESREGVVVCYRNNEVFNPHPVNVATNEWPGTYPSRRAAFMVDNSTGILLQDLTIESINPEPAQAEGLLINGAENVVKNVTIIGSGDALQANGSAYFYNVSVTGIGDNILGRGPCYFEESTFITTGGPHMWIRNTKANHGNVFKKCTFKSIGDAEAVIARAPVNKKFTYPYAEAVLLNCRLQGVVPEGFGPVGGETSNIHFWEYNSISLIDGKPVDTSKRHPVTKQLTLPNDKDVIENYRNPAYILGDWVLPFIE